MGGGAALGMSADLLVDFAAMGGGGDCWASLAAETLGRGGGPLLGGLLAPFVVVCSSKVSSSRLESRAWDLSASLCLALDAMSVS